MAADLTSGSAVALRADRSWLDLNVGGPVLTDKLFFYGSYYRPDEQPEQPRQPLRRRCRDYDSDAQRRLRQADVHADPLRAGQRAATATRSATTPARRSPSNQAGTTGSGNEARQKIGTADGSWVINTSSFADLQVHATSRCETARPSRQHRQRRHQHGARHAARHREPRHARPAHGAAADRRADRVQQPSSSRSSTATATRVNGVQTGGGTRRLRQPRSTTTTSSATPGRSATT